MNFECEQDSLVPSTKETYALIIAMVFNQYTAGVKYVNIILWIFNKEMLINKTLKNIIEIESNIRNATLLCKNII